MKKNLLNAFVALSLVSCVDSLKAQTVPNNGFENWSFSGTFEHPVVTPAPLFQSSNYESFYQHGLLNVTEVAGVTGSAMRVENLVTASNDSLLGMASWGNVEGSTMSGGIPLPGMQALTGCTLSARYTLNAATPGFIAFIPMMGGTAAGAGNGIFPGAYIYSITGTQSTFTGMTYTFSPALMMNPDSCIVVVSSGSLMTNMGTTGDFIEVDNLAWTGTTDVFPGGNLDIWQSVQAIETPMNWTLRIDGPGMLPFGKSMDASYGNYSLMLKNIMQGSNMRIGRATMGSFDCPSGGGVCNTIPGMSIASTPKSFGFYYKYSTPGVDTASAYVQLSAPGFSMVSGNGTTLLPAASWTFKSFMLPTPGVTPDSAFISFESGRWQTGVNNSTLLIDDVKFHYCTEAATIAGPTTVCINSSGVQFSVNSEFASGYTWSTSTGTINGSNTAQMVTIDNISANGTISVTKTYGDGCPDKTFNLNVTVALASTANAGTAQTVCSSDSLTSLSGSVTGATGGTWGGGTGYFMDPTDLNTTYVPSTGDITAGNVILTLTPAGTGTCPVTNGQVTVTFLASPTVSAGADQAVCFGTQVTLNGSGAVSYTWSGGVTNNTAFSSPIGSMMYTVTGTAANTCTDTDMVTVTTNTLPSVTFTLNPAVDTVCDNNASFALSGGLPSGGTYSGTGVSGGMFNPATSGAGTFAITYTYTDGNSCQAMTSKNIVVQSCTTTGIQSAADLINNMYPNPTTGSLYIEMNNNNQLYDMSVTDVTGRIIFSTSSDKSVFVLDMETYSKGVYFIRLTSNDTVINKRIVKE